MWFQVSVFAIGLSTKDLINGLLFTIINASHTLLATRFPPGLTFLEGDAVSRTNLYTRATRVAILIGSEHPPHIIDTQLVKRMIFEKESPSAHTFRNMKFMVIGGAIH